MSADRGADPLPPGGFFPVGLNLHNRLCVVVGPSNDREAIEKDAALREVGANVRRVLDPAALRDDDVAGAFFVISTPKDDALSARLRALADRHRFLLCCIDQPAYGFVAMQAIVKAGPARIGISTGGVAPRVGKVLKERLQDALGERFARFMNVLAERRRANRSRLPDVAARRQAMLEAAEGFDVKIAVQYPDWFEKDSDGIR
ncbi:MAG TPA: NAD(P)-dependent oxidoreductase [Candidatus Binatia bacterium]|nr:NAD(P)-dependent oxidoreductase [Candidatus Binatia bacterium]